MKLLEIPKRILTALVFKETNTQFSVNIIKQSYVLLYFTLLLFAECDEYHFGRNCEHTCLCQHGVCSNIKGTRLNILYNFMFFITFQCSHK